MGTTLQNGVYLPNEGERNCYAGLKTNWEILDQKVADVTALQQAVAGALHREIVESLPTTDIDPNTIYMILSGTSATENVYNEFMYVNNAWELIGTSATDLTNYYTKSEVDGKLLLKANDSDVVHKSGNETVGGQKTFTNDIVVSKNASNMAIFLQNLSYDPKTNGQSGIEGKSCGINFLTSTGDPYININAYGLSDRTLLRLTNSYFTDSQNIDSDSVEFSIYGNGARSFRPKNTSNCDLGESNKKWKGVYAVNYYYGSNNVEFSTKFVTTDTAQTISGNKTFSSINGVEPSSLSLPSGNANDVIDISSYLVNLDGTDNTYIVPANGWISIAVVGTAIAIVSSSWSDSRLRASSGDVRMLYPVLKNETLDISVTGATLAYARFIPCQGNV